MGGGEDVCRRATQVNLAWAVFAWISVAGCGPADAPSARAPSAQPPTQAAPTAGAGAVEAQRQAAAEVQRGGEPVDEAPVAPHGFVFSVRYITWIWVPRDAHKPSSKLVKQGSLGVGYGVALREPGVKPGNGSCRKGYYAVEPRGYVCADYTTTTDPQHPVVRAVRELGDNVSAGSDPVFPHAYAFSIGAPMYERVPTAEQHRLVMMRFRERPLKLGDWAKGFEDLADAGPIVPNGPAPSFLKDGGRSPLAADGLVRKNLPHGSMVSYTRAFEADGRVWLVTPELTLVPADRVRSYRPSGFVGVALPGSSGLALPLGWARKAPRELYRQQGDELVPSGEQLPVGQAVALSEDELKFKGDRYVATRGSAAGKRLWLRRDHVRVAKQTRPPSAVAGQRTWIYLSTRENTLVAYRGGTPVYATAHSPGRGGVHRGKGSVKNYTTPLGAFPINWKERWGTMSPDPGAPTSFWISDVMWTQYFKQPYALHGAYWHESFGEKMSAGCPNLAPRDARWLFDFTEPKLPAGWQGVAPALGSSSGPDEAKATLVVIGS